MMFKRMYQVLWAEDSKFFYYDHCLFHDADIMFRTIRDAALADITLRDVFEEDKPNIPMRIAPTFEAWVEWNINRCLYSDLLNVIA